MDSRKMATRLVLAFVLIAALLHCIEARSLHKRAAFYIANETACVVDNIVYYNGDPIPTDDPCEACKCRPPGFACVLRECEVKPGCRAVRRSGHCCPEYVCGCEHNGRMYRDGDEIKDSQNPCYTCHCQGSAIACAFVDCFFRVDCAPDYIPGECCPRYDHCPPFGPHSNATFAPSIKDEPVSEDSTTPTSKDEAGVSILENDFQSSRIPSSDSPIAGETSTEQTTSTEKQPSTSSEEVTDKSPTVLFYIPKEEGNTESPGPVSEPTPKVAEESESSETEKPSEPIEADSLFKSELADGKEGVVTTSAEDDENSKNKGDTASPEESNAAEKEPAIITEIHDVQNYNSGILKENLEELPETTAEPEKRSDAKVASSTDDVSSASEVSTQDSSKSDGVIKEAETVTAVSSTDTQQPAMSTDGSAPVIKPVLSNSDVAEILKTETDVKSETPTESDDQQTTKPTTSGLTTLKAEGASGDRVSKGKTEEDEDEANKSTITGSSTDATTSNEQPDSTTQKATEADKAILNSSDLKTDDADDVKQETTVKEQTTPSPTTLKVPETSDTQTSIELMSTTLGTSE